MINKIINIIKSWFTPKEEMDPHAEFYLKEKESDTLIHVEKKPEHCSGHLRFKKSCPRCQEVVV